MSLSDATFGPNEFQNPTGNNERSAWEESRRVAHYESQERIARLVFCAINGLIIPDAKPAPRHKYFTDK